MEFHHFTSPPPKRIWIASISPVRPVGSEFYLAFFRRVLQPGSINVDGSICIRYRSQLVGYEQDMIWLVATQIFVYFHPTNWEDEPILTHIFQRG